MDVKQLNEAVARALNEDEKLFEQAQDLVEELKSIYSADVPEGYIETTEDTCSLFLYPDNKIATLMDRAKIDEISIEDMKSPEKMIQFITEAVGIDIPCELIFKSTVDHVDKEGNMIMLGILYMSFKEEDLKSNNYKVVGFNGGRGYYGTYVKKMKDDTEALLTDAIGRSVHDYSVVKSLPQGDLYKVVTANGTKAFLIKDGKAKPVGIGTLLKLIQDM